MWFPLAATPSTDPLFFLDHLFAINSYSFPWNPVQTENAPKISDWAKWSFSVPKAPYRSYSLATLCWGQEPCIILLWTPKVQALFPAPQQILSEEVFKQNQINLGSKSGLCIYSTFWPWASYQGTLSFFHKTGVPSSISIGLWSFIKCYSVQETWY